MRQLAWCISIAVALAALDLPAGAAPRGVRVTLPGDPSTTVAVSWNSDSSTDGEIIYGTSMSNLDQSLSAQQTFTMPSPLNNGYTATLTGLSPNTTYFYRVGSAGNYRPAAGEDPYSFTTLSDNPCDPFTFVLIGDNRADSDGVGASDLWPGILSEALTHDPAFFVNTGDMVKNGDAPVEWSGFIDASESGWALVPSLLTLGNHDDMADNGPGAYYSQLFELPTNSENTWENYYSIDIGPIHFVSLDSNLNNTEFTAMNNWLAGDLSGTAQPWKIVFFHHAIYSRGNHFTGEEDGGFLNANLIPNFDAHDVDFVFNGHSHNYERYVPTVGADPEWDSSSTRTFPAGTSFPPGSTIPDGATGTTYLVSGGAGALTTEVAGIECIDAGCTLCFSPIALGSCEQAVWDRDKTANAVYSGKHNFAVFKVNGARIDVEVWSTQAGNTSSPEKLDEFTVDNSDTSMCGAPGQPDAGPVDNTDGGAGGPDGGGNNNGDRPDANPGAGADKSGGCGCGAGHPEGAIVVLVALLLVIRRRGTGATSA